MFHVKRLSLDNPVFHVKRCALPVNVPRETPNCQTKVPRETFHTENGVFHVEPLISMDKTCSKRLFENRGVGARVSAWGCPLLFDLD